MSELDDFNKSMAELTEYNRIQLRQTLDFYKGLSEAVGVKKSDDDMTDFELKWLGIHEDK